MEMEGDTLDKQLASLRETISLTNPITFGHPKDWKSFHQKAEEDAKLEEARVKALSHTIRGRSNDKDTCGIDSKHGKQIPRAKRGHMDGILHGIPGGSIPSSSTSRETFSYSDEMQSMNRDKNTSYFRKRDSYSEYVEARARFSKMHSVN